MTFNGFNNLHWQKLVHHVMSVFWFGKFLYYLFIYVYIFIYFFLLQIEEVGTKMFDNFIKKDQLVLNMDSPLELDTLTNYIGD